MLTIPSTDTLTLAEAKVLALVEAGHSNQMIAARLAITVGTHEAEVFQVCNRGLSNQEIGDQLAVTVGTIKGHLVHTYRKLNLRNRTGAVAKARQMGLLK